MEKIGKLQFLRKNKTLFIIAGAALVVTLVLSFTKLLSRLEYRVYDAMLGIQKHEKIDDTVLLIDVDDKSIGELGEWPWPRDKIADVVTRLREFNADYVVFDIEYLTPSKLEVNENLAQVAQDNFQQTYGEVSHAMDILQEAYEDFSLAEEGEEEMSLSELKESLMESYVGPALEDMSNSLYENLFKENDVALRRALQYFGNSFLTINREFIGMEGEGYDEEKDYAYSRFTFDNVSDEKNKLTYSQYFTPAIKAISSGAKGAGFTNVIVDTDGKRRRNILVGKYKDRYYAQLALRPLLDRMDVQSIELKGKYLILHDALNPSSLKKHKGERHDIRIPLDENGRMLVNWSTDPYETGILHCPVSNFLIMRDLENNLLYDLRMVLTRDWSDKSDEEQQFIEDNFMQVWEYYSYLNSLLNTVLEGCEGFDSEGNAIGEGLDLEGREEYLMGRRELFDYLTQICDAYGEYFEVPEEVAALQESVAAFNEGYQTLSNLISNKFCIIGNSASSSTDVSITPFSRSYPQMGMHANVASQILQENFIFPVNELVGIAIAFVVLMALMLYLNRMGLVKRILFEAAGIFALTLIYFLMMVLFKVYIPVFLPFVMMAAVFVIDTIISVKNDRRFIKDTFSSYVAPKVVEELIKNPETAKLGGRMKNLTALFSDVKSFSKMSEKINDPSELLDVMNEYLGALGDVITSDECQGTLDKFVGDEIVSFFGAPLDDDLCAYHAILAGIRMKQVDEEYNRTHKDEFLKKYDYPIVLESRVGMNYGQMTVGNIGTSKKLNYSIMGDNVNLASRLEGVNKAYGSWIMASESAWLECNSGANKDKILARKLDSVRVINIERPVPIYNIVGVRDECPAEQIDSVELFNEAIELYLKKEFKKAANMFKKAGNLYLPDQDVSKAMIARCLQNLKDGVPEDWDGVFVMKSK